MILLVSQKKTFDSALNKKIQILGKYLAPMYKLLAMCLYFIPAIKGSLIISLVLSLLQTYFYIKMFDYTVWMEFSAPYLGILYVSHVTPRVEIDPLQVELQVLTIHVICIWGAKRVKKIYQMVREWKTINSNCSLNHPKMKQALRNMTQRANITIFISLLLTCAAVVADTYNFCHDNLVTVYLIDSNFSTRGKSSPV